MMKMLRLGAAALALSATNAGAGPASVASMQWERRVLLVSSPDPVDPNLEAQHKAMDGWKAEGEARDVSIVRIVGNRVEGSADRAEDLRRRYSLPSDSFEVVLIGKDGSVAVRSDKPFAAATLIQTIDAMPMRRAGQR